jgi:hypothetical protein
MVATADFLNFDVTTPVRQLRNQTFKRQTFRCCGSQVADATPLRNCNSIHIKYADWFVSILLQRFVVFVFVLRDAKCI